MVDGSVKIGVDLETQQFDKQISYIEDQMENLEVILNAKSGWNSEDIHKAQVEYEKLGNQLISLQDKQRKYNEEVKRSTKAVEKISSTMGNAVKSAKLWVGAIFGVRSAYLGIRKAMSLVSAQNEEIKGKIEAMSNAMANLLEPVVSRIVNFLYKMMVYLDYIVQAWFGISLFSKANDKALKSAVGSARALRNELMGFDEAQKLTDDGGTSGVGATGTGDFTMPDVEIPKWVEWLADNKDKILQGLKEIGIWIGVVFATSKLLKFFDLISKIGGAFTGLGKIFNLTGLEMGLIIGSIIVIIGVLIKIIKDLTGIFRDKEKANNSLRDSEKNLKDAIELVKKAEQNLIDIRLQAIDVVKRKEQAEKDLEEAQRRTKISGEDLAKQVENGTLTYEKMDAAQREVYEKYLKLQSASDELTKLNEKEKDAVEKLTVAQQNEAIAKEKERIQGMLNRGEYKEAAKALGQLEKDHKLSWGHMRTLLKEATSGMDKDTKEIFADSLPKHLKKGLEPTNYEKALGVLERYLKNKFRIISKGLEIGATIVSKITGKSGTGSVMGVATGGVVGLASGGIINLPNQGVPLRQGVIGGESGAEGVIPLTNSQMMAELGQSIGRWITVNLNNEVKMNNRTIAREVVRVQNEDSFVRNE